VGGAYLQAGVVIVYAKTDPAAGAHGITAFILEKGMKGFTTAQKLDKLGMRGSDTCELVLENVEVRAEGESTAGNCNVRREGVGVMLEDVEVKQCVCKGGRGGGRQCCHVGVSAWN
jgi:isovaleryl-CoA dehydrogenase